MEVVTAISNNQLIAAAFGARAVQGGGSVKSTNPLDPVSGDDRSSINRIDASGDTVQISQHARRLAEGLVGAEEGSRFHRFEHNRGREVSRRGDAAKPSESGRLPVEKEQSGITPYNELSDEDKARVDELKQADAEVRRHEQAHVAAGGQYVRGGATFEYTKGPDGKQYAVSGEVQIDTSPIEGDPRATVMKMQQVRRAALAPAQPSSQDRAVAAQALREEQKARGELAKQGGTQDFGYRIEVSAGHSEGRRQAEPIVDQSRMGIANQFVTRLPTSHSHFEGLPLNAYQSHATPIAPTISMSERVSQHTGNFVDLIV